MPQGHAARAWGGQPAFDQQVFWNLSAANHAVTNRHLCHLVSVQLGSLDFSAKAAVAKYQKEWDTTA